MGMLSSLLILIALVSSTLGLTCNNSFVAEYIEKRKNATQEIITGLQTIILSGFANNNFVNETTLYNTLVSALNLTGGSEGFHNFSTALNVISDSYFKACFGPEEEKPTKADSPELLSQFLFLLENRTSITTVRELYGQLSCLEDFSQSSQSSTKNVSCASKKTIKELYDCLSKNDLQCIFNVDNPSNCGTSGNGNNRPNHCLAFAVDTTGSMSEEIFHARQVVNNFIASEQNTFTLCYVLVGFNDYDQPEWPSQGSECTYE